MLSEARIKTDSDKTSVLRNRPSPRKVNDVRKFLVLLGITGGSLRTLRTKCFESLQRLRARF